MARSVGVAPLDGSATAESVLAWAVTIARVLDLRLSLIRLVPEAWPGGDERGEAALEPARHYLAGVAASLQGAGIEVETRAQPVGSDIASGIVGLADSLDAAVILIASHGYTGVRRWVLGSVADGVVRTAARPVLVVPARAQTGEAQAPGVRRVLLTLDGSPRAEAALATAVDLAKAAGATLDLLGVQPWSWMIVSSYPTVVIPEGLDEEIERALEEYLAGVQAGLPSDVKAEHHLRRQDPALGILDHIADTGADLVVMATRGRSGLSRWALGSVADKVLRAGACPVLLVHAPSEDDAGTAAG